MTAGPGRSPSAPTRRSTATARRRRSATSRSATRSCSARSATTTARTRSWRSSCPCPWSPGRSRRSDGDSLTLKTRGGTTRTVTLTGSTTYKLGRADGTKADVKVGSVVVATGVEGSGDTFTAKTVRIQVRLARIGGEVTAKTKDTITVKQRDGQAATIKVGSDTKFVLRGTTTPALADIAVGMRVQAFGTLGADGIAGRQPTSPRARPSPSRRRLLRASGPVPGRLDGAATEGSD